MFCTNCLKLSILHTLKKCSRCQNDVFNNISILCEPCSLRDNLCGACLKKLVNPATSTKRGCNGCGK